MRDVMLTGRASMWSAAFILFKRGILLFALAAWLATPLLMTAGSTPAGAATAAHHDGMTLAKAHAQVGYDMGSRPHGHMNCSGPAAQGAACFQTCLSHCSLAMAASVFAQRRVERGSVILTGIEVGYSLSTEPTVPPPRFVS